MTKAKGDGGMGFRDLAFNNDSLLAKQAWRLLQDKSSLLYKVFKPRFFPNCTIMEAVDSSHGSYAWKSILHGRDVIKRGACWRISNRQSVQIWQHSWLPTKHPTHVLSPILEGWEEAKVEVLINEATRTWNENIVNGLFVPDETALIKKIPLSKHPTKDKLYWPWTQNGQYSFKSEYRFLKSKADKEVAEATQDEDRKFWFSIWALQVPNKIRNFMWCACCDSLPMKANLRRRHIMDSSLCKWCLREEENPLHALWSCRELDLVWSESEWNFRQTINPSNFKKLLSWILNNQGKPELFVMTTWGIWYKWNQVHLHKPCCTSDLIATQAKERLQEFTAALPPKPPRMTRTRDIWKPPDVSYFKINFDGGVFRNENKSSIGVVIWDHTSFVIA